MPHVDSGDSFLEDQMQEIEASPKSRKISRSGGLY